MFKAYKKYWMGYVDFTGRSSRSDYWLAVLANAIVTIILFTVVIVAIVFDMICPLSSRQVKYLKKCLFLKVSRTK
ncbi:DUF805 domain-containing protein, partial [Streptococcus sp. VTCC 12814]|uniref:DUF805 domain-containing protein n=1 Tax=Streptococcus raffinosi TaxID=3053355 RepID=UPI0025786E2A